MHPKVATWVVLHRFYPIAVAELWRTARRVAADPMGRLAIAKEVLHGAAMLTKRRAAAVGAETVPERLHWAFFAFRGHRQGRPGVALVRKAASAFPTLARWLPAGSDYDNPQLLGDLVANLAAESLNTEILEMISEGGPPAAKGSAKLSKLHALAATWRSQRRRLALNTIIDENGEPQDNTEIAARLLVNHWTPVFRERKISAEEALEVMPHTPVVPANVEWRLDRIQFGELVARPRDGAPGPDGLPYSAWRLAGEGIYGVLYEAYEAFLGGAPLPAGFNDCLLVFIPKGDEVGDRGVVARTPASTRPISLSNTASKFIALAVNRPLAQVALATVHPRQRGFVGGRSLTDNVVEIEGYGQSYAIADAEDPGILMFDLMAAFPSLAHQWLFVVLRRMRVPRWFIQAIRALYRDCSATVVLMGLRWGSFPMRSGIRQGCPASGSLFALAFDPCIRYIMHMLGPKRGVITAYADDVSAAVKELYEALRLLDAAFLVVEGCSALALHPGKVVIIPLWKFVEADVRAAVSLAAPRLAAAAIRDYGKLLGIYIGPGADAHQWTAVREELRARARFLASLGLAWSGVLPLYRSHVLPVAAHVAQMSRIPKHMLRNESSCLAVILKTPYRAVPPAVLLNGKAFGLSLDVPGLGHLGLAATFRAACASSAFPLLIAEHRRARASRYSNISPFLRAWTAGGVVGHLNNTYNELSTSFATPFPDGKGLQAWVIKELQKGTNLDTADRAVARRASTMLGRPISIEAAGRLREHLHKMRGTLPPVVLSSMIRSSSNAWTTTGRFQGPNSRCPFGCGAADGDKWAHFPGCPSIRRMWGEACPNAHAIFANLTLEESLLLSPGLPNEAVPQVAIWTDIVGHLSNDIRANATPSNLVLATGADMIVARLRHLSVLSDGAGAVISLIRAALMPC